MFVFIDKSIHDRGSPHRLSLVAETPGDLKLLKLLIDSYSLSGCGIDPETCEPVQVSIALEIDQCREKTS